MKRIIMSITIAMLLVSSSVFATTENTTKSEVDGIIKVFPGASELSDKEMEDTTGKAFFFGFSFGSGGGLWSNYNSYGYNSYGYYSYGYYSYYSYGYNFDSF